MQTKATYNLAKMSILSLPLALSLSCGQSADTANLKALKPDTLSGTWAKQFILSSEARAAGTKSKTKVVRLSIVNLKNSAAGIQAEERICDVSTLNSGASSISFPAAIINAFQTRRYTYTFDEGGQSLNLKDGVEVLGAQLSNPFQDSLPRDKNDARVIDQDRDGQIGVTVKVKAQVIITVEGDLYVAQRTFWQESAKVESDNLISGRVDWKQEQYTLGASNPLFTAITPSVETLPNESFVNMKRLPAALDCNGLKAQAASLFAQVAI